MFGVALTTWTRHMEDKQIPLQFNAENNQPRFIAYRSNVIVFKNAFTN